MTNYFVRAMRDGRPQSLEIDELTDAELEALPMPPEMGWRWVVALARWIRDNVEAVPGPGPDMPYLAAVAEVTYTELEALALPPEAGRVQAIEIARWIRDNVKALPVPED